MRSRTLAVAAGLALLLSPVLRPQDTSGEADLAEAIRLVDQAEFEKALALLDRAIGALRADPGRVKDLGRAYLHKGVAQVGLGQDAQAKACFKDALTPLRLAAQQEARGKAEVKDLTLGEFGFSPKVISLFEEAKRETIAEAERQLRTREGGPKKGLLWLGGGLAVAGGAAAALAGGGSAPGLPARPTGQLAFLGSSPPPGSTLTLSGEQVGIDISLNVTYSEGGQYTLHVGFVAPDHPPFVNNTVSCGGGGSSVFSLSAGRPQTVSVRAGTSRSQLAFASCPLPLDISAVAVGLEVPQTGTQHSPHLVETRFSVSYRVVG